MIGFPCPYCQNDVSKVLDSKHGYRRHLCCNCGMRFTSTTEGEVVMRNPGGANGGERPVICFNAMGVEVARYKNATVAGAALKVHASSIRRAARPTAGGFQWVYG